MKLINRFYHFVLYNNTFTLIIAFLILSGGTALAANEDLRKEVVSSIISSESKTSSVNNSFILRADLDNFEPAVQIVNITEDAGFYYITYELTTIDLVQGTWKETILVEDMTLEKDQVGEQDLGLFLAEEFSELVASKKLYLKEVQIFEQEIGNQEKVIITKYSGLIGRFLDDTQETFEGYDPVVEPQTKIVIDSSKVVKKEVDDHDLEIAPREEVQKEDFSDDTSETDVDVGDVILSTAPETSTGSSTSVSEVNTLEGEAPTAPEVSTSTVAIVTDTVPPLVTLNGGNTVSIQIPAVYTEFGAMAIDNADGDLSDLIIISGTVDTSIAGIYEITYGAVDGAGNESTVVRTVTVIEPEIIETVSEDAPVEAELTSDTSTASST
ncbi:MAG: hypothetical protein ACI92I_000451 [Acidimicrobiales bacterium]|jgi:hypothetical protein